MQLLVIVMNDLVERQLMLVHFKHPLFNGVLDNETNDFDFFGLAHSVHSVDGLLFNGWVPPRVYHQHVVCLY